MSLDLPQGSSVVGDVKIFDKASGAVASPIRCRPCARVVPARIPQLNRLAFSGLCLYADWDLRAQWRPQRCPAVQGGNFLAAIPPPNQLEEQAHA